MKADPQINADMLPRNLSDFTEGCFHASKKSTHIRNIIDGYQRGWGLQFGGLSSEVESDPLYRTALRNARLNGTESLLSDIRLQNLFLILKDGVTRLPGQDVIELGAYRCGTVFFIATVLKELVPDARIYAADSFRGIPEHDELLDRHRSGDFWDVNLSLIKKRRGELKLDNIEILEGDFRETVRLLDDHARQIGLAHIDCDTAPSVRFLSENIWSYMTSGGYVVFDDDLTSSCLGATEVVEKMIMERALHSEQAWPHHVFRAEGAFNIGSESVSKPALMRLRQCRSFSSKEVPKPALQSILEAAHEAPSVGNQKPWRIVNLCSKESRRVLEESFNKAEKITADEADNIFVKKGSSLQVGRFLEAPIQLSIFTEKRLNVGHKQGWATMPKALEYSTTGMAMRLWAAAQSIGLGGAWVSCLMPRMMEKHFADSESWKFTAHIALGYPLERPTVKSKHECLGFPPAPPLQVLTR